MSIVTENSAAGIEDRPDNTEEEHTIDRAANPATAARSTADLARHTAEARSDEGYLLALDVDGTLVDHDGAMSDVVRDAARAVAEAGHRIILATGRSLGATLPIVKSLGLEHGFTVCCNGGVTVRLDPTCSGHYEVLNRVTFDPAPALTALRRELPSAKYALEDDAGNFLSTERFQDSSFGIEARGVDFQELLSATAVRVVVYSTDDNPEEFARAIDAVGLHGVTYSVGWSSWLDIAASGVTKATALENLRRRLDIDPARTLAIGDGRNDVEMLTWAARGVAMGQAPDEVAAVADEVTASVYDDGAAKILAGLL